MPSKFVLLNLFIALEDSSAVLYLTNAYGPFNSTAHKPHFKNNEWRLFSFTFFDKFPKNKYDIKYY